MQNLSQWNIPIENVKLGCKCNVRFSGHGFKLENSTPETAEIRFYLQILRQRHLAALWASQVLSAIGDQLHSLAVLWISVQVGGARAGFVVVSGTLAGLVLGLIGGVYADRWNRRTTMVVVDLMRAVAVFVLALVAATGALQLWQMALIAIIVSGLGSLFAPCMAASLPALTSSDEVLRAMTSLMVMTFRIARLVGPAIAAGILYFCPIHTFFIIDALTYVVSAWAIWTLGSQYSWQAKTISQAKGLRAIWEDLAASFSLGIRHRQFVLTFAVGFFNAWFWSSAYIIGIPLMVKEAGGLGVGSYAAIICAYGFGNVMSNVFLGPLKLHHRSAFFNCISAMIMGAGFTGLAFAPNMYLACAAAIFAATGGPLGDVAAIGMLQRLPDEHRGKLNSLGGFIGGLGSAIGLSLAPFIYGITGGAHGVALFGASLVVLGLPGFILGIIGQLRRQSPSRQPQPETVGSSSR
jgi:MFS family permease